MARFLIVGPTARLSRPQPLEGAKAMTYAESYYRVKLFLDLVGPIEALKRLQGVEGPEERLVAQTAERAKRQGAGEDLRESRAVAPGTEEEAAEHFLGLAAEYEGRALIDAKDRLNFSSSFFEGVAAGLRHAAEFLGAEAKEPTTTASGADANTSTPDLFAYTEAQTSPPTGGKRSGRRNRELSQPPSVDNTPA